MGFKLVYDPAMLELIPAGTSVYTGNWPFLTFVDGETAGEIHMAGARLSGVSGSDIKLGTVRFRSRQTGAGELRLLDRGATVDCFVLDDDPQTPTVLDGQFADGVFMIAAIRPPLQGDVNGDETVGLADAIVALKMLAKMAHGTVHANADINGDNKIGLPEVFYILQKVSALR